VRILGLLTYLSYFLSAGQVRSMYKIVFASLAAFMLLAPHFALATLPGPQDFVPLNDDIYKDFFEHRYHIISIYMYFLNVLYETLIPSSKG